MDKRKKHQEYTLKSKRRLLESLISNEDSTSQYFINATKKRKVHNTSYMDNLDNNPRIDIVNPDYSTYYGGADVDSDDDNIPPPDRNNLEERIRKSELLEQSSEGVTRKYITNLREWKNVLMTPEDYYKNILEHTDVAQNIYNLAQEMKNIKVYFVFWYVYTSSEDEEGAEISLFHNTRNIIISSYDTVQSVAMKMQQVFYGINEEDFSPPESGLIFQYMDLMETHINQYQIMAGAGGSYHIPKIFDNKYCLDPCNSTTPGDDCFLDAINSCLNKLKLCRIYNWNYNITTPVPPVNNPQIEEFENKHSLNINIFAIDEEDEKHPKILPLRYSNIDKKIGNPVINLLFIPNNNDTKDKVITGHYCAIKSLNQVFSIVFNVVCANKNQPQVCPYCPFYTYNYSSFANHKNVDCQKPDNVIRIFPDKDSEEAYMKFEHSNREDMLPVVIYYDTEAYIVPIDNSNEKSKTLRSFKSEHKLKSYCLYIESKIPQIVSKTIINEKKSEDQNLEKEFIEDIMTVYKRVRLMFNVFNKYPKEWDQNAEDLLIHESKTVCDFCNKPFNAFNPKVLHHNHFTGKYIASIHSKENLAIKVKGYKLPVIGHNAMRYDQHFIIRELAEIAKQTGLQLDILPSTDENYKAIFFDRIMFIDSYQFLSEKLSSLTEDLKITAMELNCKKEKFKVIYSNFPHLSEEIIDKYLLQKNYFPYEYVSSLEKYDSQFKDLSIEDFYSSLSCSTITLDQYKFAMEVNDILFNGNATIGEYCNFYLKIDVYILCSVFEDFRENIFNSFHIDPCWYVSIPSLSLDLFLKESSVNIELIHEPEIYDFILQGLYGGLSYIGKRKEDANNKYMKDYDESKPSKYIVYQDMNSLYPSVMNLCKLPIRNYNLYCYEDPGCPKLHEILDATKFYDKNDCLETTGYMLEVDIEPIPYYKEYLREYPILPTRRKVKYDELSEIQKEKLQVLYSQKEDEKKDQDVNKYVSSEKLITDLLPKEHYVIHYQNLKFAVDHGYRVTKVYKVLTFLESKHMANHIDKLKDKRVHAKEMHQTSLANIMKKLLNSLYGKTLERVDKRRSIKLVVSENQARKAIRDPWFDRIDTIHGDLRLVHYHKKMFKINKPIQIGMTILALSKLLMQKYWYDGLLHIFDPKQVRLCMTDTDSLLFSVKTKDIYWSFNRLQNWIDGSNMNFYPFTTYYNWNSLECKPGTLNKLKFEEQDGKNFYVITKFRGLKSKCYYYEKECVSDGSTKSSNRCKGLITAISSTITGDDYDEMVDGYVSKQKFGINHIRSKNHHIYTAYEEKIGLTYFDDKRFFEDDYETVPYGYNN